jgi:23S rRNA (guanosine2251-2'-O)-methyltransferase
MKPDTTNLIYGRNPVREALAEPETSIEKLWMQENITPQFASEIRTLAKTANVAVQMVPLDKLNRMLPRLVHQGIAAQVAPIKFWDVDDLLTHIAPNVGEVRSQKPVILLLDQIEDPHNFGAILRSAVASGVKGVIIPDRNMAPLSAVAIKASAGTALRMPIARVTNLANVIDQMKERGYWVAGLAGGGEHTIWDMDWDRPLGLVIGSEGSGLRPRVMQVCDYLVSIPMHGDAESLNASVAAGIALFVATKR